MYDTAVDTAYQRYQNDIMAQTGGDLGRSNLARSASQGVAVKDKEDTLQDLLQKTENKAGEIRFRLEQLHGTLFGQETLPVGDACKTPNVRPINDIVRSTLNHVDEIQSILNMIEQKIGGRS